MPVGATQGPRRSTARRPTWPTRHTSNVIPDSTARTRRGRGWRRDHGGRIDRRLPRARQWLAEPVHPTTRCSRRRTGSRLDATAGAGDSNTKYYGEPSIATLGLAPGTRASSSIGCATRQGNSEPGLAEPTVTVARQRADNYAVGFLEAGAAARGPQRRPRQRRHLHPKFVPRRTSRSYQHVADPAKRNWQLGLCLRPRPDAGRDDLPEYPSRPRTASGAQDPPSLSQASPPTMSSPVTSDKFSRPRRPSSSRQRRCPRHRAHRCSPAPTQRVDQPRTLPPEPGCASPNRRGSTTADGTTVPLVAVQGVDEFQRSPASSSRPTLAGTRPAIRSLNVGTAISPNGDGVWDTE